MRRNTTLKEAHYGKESEEESESSTEEAEEEKGQEVSASSA
jgi:hypothetical protein